METLKKHISLTVCLALFLLTASCTQDPWANENGSSNGKGVKVTLNLLLPEAQFVETRAAGSRSVYENTVANVYLLVFDQDDIFIECTEAVDAAGANSFYTLLTPRNAQSSIYVVANAPTIMEERKNTWTSGVTTLSQVKEQLLKASLFDSGAGAITKVPVMPPLVSVIPQTVERIDRNMTLENIELQRATAKVTINNNAGNDLFIEGANLCKVPVRGYVFAGMNYASISTSEYWGEQDGGYSLNYPIRRATDDDPLYCYESAVSNATFMIVKASYKGVDGYYRIDFVDTDRNQLALQRNFHYKINFNKVQNPGFRSAAEAKANPAFNLMPGNVEIEVSDGYSHDIVSNGEYYLGVENSEYIIYSTQPLSDELVTNVICNAPSTAWQGGVTISAYDASGNPIVSNVSATNPFSGSNDGEVNKGELRITMPAEVFSADIQLRVANLERTVRVRRIGENISFGGIIPFEKEYVSGKITSPQSWIKFVTNDDADIDEGLDQIVNPYGGLKVNLFLSSNLLLNPDAEARDAFLYLARANDKGRAKVKIHQPPYDIFKPEATPITNPYAGTFHRHNQTGERVIKMGDSSTGPWVAEVVAGRNFIRMLLGDSDDRYIRTGNPGDAENYQVYNAPQAKTTIVGNGEILFRVGLKDAIPANEHRYGVILITHSGGTSRIFVRQGEAPDYVYRHEDPVLNGWTSNPAVPRPKTVRISPYNLTDPRLGLGITEGTSQIYADHNSMPLDYHPDSPTYGKFNKAKFTEYPSQAGYLFIWNTLVQSQSLEDRNQWIRAIHPTRTGSHAQLLGSNVAPDSTYPNEHSYDPNGYGKYSGNGDGKIPYFGFANLLWPQSTYNFTQTGRWFEPKTDPCPYGYRYPHAGLVNTTSTGGATLYYGQDAYNSELLQAMFYDPHISSDDAQMKKYTLWGYYADGFFDRLPITTPPGMNAAANSMVVKGGSITESTTGNDIGYAGIVIFNPFDYSSIFYPAPGWWSYGGLRDAGNSYHYWTTDKTSTTASSQYVLHLWGSPTSFILVDSQGTDYFPKSVRPVRDESIRLSDPAYD